MSNKNNIESQSILLEADKQDSDANDEFEVEVLDHSDLSFLMNHALDELEAEYSETEENEFEDNLNSPIPSFIDEEETTELDENVSLTPDDFETPEESKSSDDEEIEDEGEEIEENGSVEMIFNLALKLEGAE